MDRFHRGLVAGIVGGVAMNLWTAFAVTILNLEIIRFIDWAGVILYGSPPDTHFKGFYALIIQLTWVGLLGVVFAYLMRYTTSRGYLIKGAFYGVVVGLIIYAIPTIFQTPHIANASIETVLSNHTGGLIWGLLMAQTLRWLDKRGSLETVD
ncbi:MAG: hypothetical protein APF76_03515 [Desulfitibacter sp. BRH_c19]|nr:MAG: hypothetical protein APF76_03515 [Desulfitibacter sp. BRH_c19]